MAIDWSGLARQVGDCDGSSSTDSARRALELIIGEEDIRRAVDHWVSLELGAFTAEKVLTIIGSTIAMERCYEIYRTEPNTQRAYRALGLLSSMADDRVLGWVREFMEDSDENVRWHGMLAICQALERPLNDDGIALAKELLAKAESDPAEAIRKRATENRQRLKADSTLEHLDL